VEQEQEEQYMYTLDNSKKHIAFLDSNNIVENIVLFEKETSDVEILSFIGIAPQENSVSYVEIKDNNVILDLFVGYEFFEDYFRPVKPEDGSQWNKDLFIWTSSPSQELLDVAILLDGIVDYNVSTGVWTTTPPEDRENYIWHQPLLKWIPKPPDETFSYIWDDESNSWVSKI
jgi:hypothetical protein